jgi:hypothetical protein
LCKLNNLSHLNLRETKVTDAGLGDLAQLKRLKKLNLARTRVTDKGIAELKKMLRGCEISY